MHAETVTGKRVGVVLVNWNSGEHTIPCIESLRSGAVTPDRVVVVDNASCDGSPEAILRRYPDVELIRNRENTGFTGANNRGIRHLLSMSCDYLWILNNDTTVDERCLLTLRTHMDAHPGIAACTGKIRYFDGRLLWYAGSTHNRWTLRFAHRGQGEEDTGQYDVVEEVPFISGCCMFIRREAIERVGMFDDHFFAYGEDSDWCLRAGKMDMRLHYVPQALIRHAVSASVNKLKKQSTGGSTSPFSVYITSRNRISLIRKHANNALQAWTASLAAAAWFFVYAVSLVALLRTDKLSALATAIYDGIAEPIDAVTEYSAISRYLR